MRRTLIAGVLLALPVALLPTGPAGAGVENCYDIDDTHQPTIHEVIATDATVGWRGTSLITVTAHVTDDLALEDCDWDGLYDDLYSSGVYAVDFESDLIGLGDGTSYTGFYPQDATLVQGTIYDGWWQAEVPATSEDNPGLYEVTVDVYDNGLNQTVAYDAATYRLRMQTITVANAKPEPVRRGRTVRVVGSVVRPAYLDFEFFVGQRLTFWFKKAGTHRWQYMGSRRTNADGEAVRRFEARATGKWQVRYAGSADYLASRAADRVKVVR